MKPVPQPNKDEEDSVTAEVTEEGTVAAPAPKENGYLTLPWNVPFLCVMLASLPAVMGLYIPYMFLPGVSAVGVAASQTCKRAMCYYVRNGECITQGSLHKTATNIAFSLYQESMVIGNM